MPKRVVQLRGTWGESHDSGAEAASTSISFPCGLATRFGPRARPSGEPTNKNRQLRTGYTTTTTTTTNNNNNNNKQTNKQIRNINPKHSNKRNICVQLRKTKVSILYYSVIASNAMIFTIWLWLRYVLRKQRKHLVTDFLKNFHLVAI